MQRAKKRQWIRHRYERGLDPANEIDVWLIELAANS